MGRLNELLGRKDKMRPVTIAIALLALSSAGFAADVPTEAQVSWLKLHAPDGFEVYADGTWVSSGTDVSGTEYSIRLEDLMAQTSNFRTVWMRGNHIKDKTVPYRTTTMKIAFSCKEQTYSVGTIVHYKQDGNVFAQFTFPYQPRDLIPGSIAEHWAKRVCWS